MALDKNDGTFNPSIEGVISGKTSQVTGMNGLLNDLIGNDNYLKGKKLDKGSYTGTAEDLSNDTKSRLPYVNTIEDLKKQTKYAIGDVIEVLGYYAKGDGGGHPRQKKPTGYNGADAVVGVDGSIWGIVHNGEVRVSWFGANESKEGSSLSLNKCLNDTSVKKVIFDLKKTYIEPSVDDWKGVQVERNDLIIDGNGCCVYPVNQHVYRVLNFKNCKNIEIMNFKSVGYFDYNHFISNPSFYLSIGERFSFLSFEFSCENIKIHNNHIDNYLGDCIYFGTNMKDGADVYPSKNIKVYNNFLKERHGNGLRTWEGGTRSRLAFTTNDIVGLDLYGNTFVGSVDFEPDANGQSLVDIKVRNNNFICKYGIEDNTSVYTEEQLGDSTTSRLLAFTGVAGNPIISNVVVDGNNWDGFGLISMGDIYKVDVISNNVMKFGYIKISGKVTDVKIYNNYTGERNIIQHETFTLGNSITNSFILNNVCTEELIKSDSTLVISNTVIRSNVPIGGTNITFKPVLNEYELFLSKQLTKVSTNPKDTSLINCASNINVKELGMNIGEIKTLVIIAGGAGSTITGLWQEGNILLATYSSITFTKFSDEIYPILSKYVKPTAYVSLDTPYHAAQMSKLGILDSYHNYLSELHEYEKQQNVQSDSEIMALNVLQPPVIPTEVEEYAKECNLI